MATNRLSGPPAGTVRQPHNPISRRQIETVVSRSVAIFGVVFALQTLPATISQLPQETAPLGPIFAVALFGGMLASVALSFAKRGVGPVNGYIAIVFLLSLVTWPFIAANPTEVEPERPWLWFLVTVGTSAAAVAWRPWIATVYLVVAPLAYGVVRITPSGGGKDWQSAGLDTAYAIILGGGVLILITLLRQAAASVDAAQSNALDRYAHAVRQHATEVERVQVDAIVHDSVLTTLLSAARAYTPEAKALATRMARNAMGHLKDAAAASPDDDAVVTMDQLSNRIMGATASLSAPFEFRVEPIEGGLIPAQAAEALYSASVQAMVNSLQHAGSDPTIQRWLAIESATEGGIRIDIGDTGAGFAFGGVPTERLGLRVSIIERVGNAGGMVEVESSEGAGTVIHLVWPDPRGVTNFVDVDIDIGQVSQ